MFKKAGLVLAVSAAGLLAVSPLAFACDNDDDGHGHHHVGRDEDDHGGGRDGAHFQSGLVNVQDVGVQVPVQLCNNSIVEGALGILAFAQRNSDSHDGTCVQRNNATF